MISGFGFERRVAMRFMVEGRTQTLLIITGVAAGVAVVAYISALMLGVQENLIDKTLGAQAHITISTLDDVVLPARAADTGAANAGDTVTMSQTQPRAQRPRAPANWRLLMPILEATPGVAVVSPIVSAGGLAVRGEVSKSIAILGVELERHDRVVKLREKIKQGVARLGPGEGIIGMELASDLGVRVGDRLNISRERVRQIEREALNKLRKRKAAIGEYMAS